MGDQHLSGRSSDCCTGDAPGAPVEASQTQNSHTPKEPRGAGAYPDNLRPVARRGDIVEIIPRDEFYRVRGVFVQPGVNAFDSDAGNSIDVSGNGTSNDNQATELELSDNWLGQFRLVDPNGDIPSSIEIEFDQGGQQAPLFTTRRSKGHIDSDTAAYAGIGGLTEFYVYEDGAPYFSFSNSSGSTVTMEDIRFAGYQIQLSNQPVEPPTDTVPVTLPTSSLSTTSSR